MLTRIAAYQFDVRRGDVAANRVQALAGLEAAAEAGVQLLVLPEMWPTSFAEATDELVAESERSVAALAERAAELGLIFAGSAFAPAEQADLADRADREGYLAPGIVPRPYNRLQLFVGGRPALVYDKVHLFSPTAETEGFSAGKEPPPTVETELGLVSGVVCYDLRFGPLLRHPLLDRAEILICPAQWPRPRGGHWEALLRGRAVEHQCVVVGCNRTGTEVVGRRALELDFPGRSLIVGADGAVLAAGDENDGLVVAELDLDQVRKLRKRVPVIKDQRAELYRTWRR